LLCPVLRTMTPTGNGFDDDPVTAGRVIVTARVKDTGRVRSTRTSSPAATVYLEAVQFEQPGSAPSIAGRFPVTSHQAKDRRGCGRRGCNETAMTSTNG